MCELSNADAGMRPPPRRTRRNAPRSSVGMLSGNFSGSVSVSGFGFSGASAFSSAGGGGGANARLINPGTHNVNRGFFVRTIIAVVAIYNGSAAKIKIPKTNPPNPYRRECAKRAHALAENMSKLNSDPSMQSIIST